MFLGEVSTKTPLSGLSFKFLARFQVEQLCKTVAWAANKNGFIAKVLSKKANFSQISGKTLVLSKISRSKPFFTILCLKTFQNFLLITQKKPPWPLTRQQRLRILIF